MAAIFDFRHTQTLDSLTACLPVLHPFENMVCRWTFVAILYSNWDTCNNIFSTAILDFWLSVSSSSVSDSAIEKFDPENIVVAVEILFLASLEAEMHLGVV